MVAYHDEEWGVPLHDERRLFEMLCLEGAQAGLSWKTILDRREGYREVYDGFDAEAMAGYDDTRQMRLLADRRIIRNKAKVSAFRENARAVLKLREQSGGLDPYLWGFVGGEPIMNHFDSMAQVPAQSPLAEEVSSDLKRRGFAFVGPVIVYAYLQSVGLVNDHLVGCFRRSPGWSDRPAPSSRHG